MAKLNHHYIRGIDGDCYWRCGYPREEHPLVIDLAPTIRRPSQIDHAMGGQLPRFEMSRS